jgi:hypothetical protein
MLKEQEHIPNVNMSIAAKRCKDHDWTRTEDAILKRMCQEGKKMPDMVHELHHNPMQIKRRKEQLSIPQSDADQAAQGATQHQG